MLTLWEAPNSEGLEQKLRGFGPIPPVKPRAVAHWSSEVAHHGAVSHGRPSHNALQPERERHLLTSYRVGSISS
jgi:hypothetical protein